VKQRRGGSEVEFIVNGKEIPLIAPNGLTFGVGAGAAAIAGAKPRSAEPRRHTASSRRRKRYLSG